jgi:hybrid cluster-associated redox disulfide protein
MTSRFHEDMTMDAIMQAWPQTIRVVLSHGMLCVGCPIAAFHTPFDAAREHHQDVERFLRDLERSVGPR